MSITEKIEDLKNILTHGVSPAMATPLVEGSSQVNAAVVPQLVDFLIVRGVQGLFVGGSTGEGILLPVVQRKILHETTIEAVNRRVPSLIHVGGVRMEVAIELAQHAAEIGAEAIVAITPIFYGMHDDALVHYYKSIADAAPQIPLFCYDAPHMAVNGVSGALLARLCQEIPSLAGLKSSNQNSQLIRKQIELLPDDRIILVGNEPIALGSLAMGANGMISGLSTAVPEPFVALTKSFGAGDLDEARHWQKVINSLLAVMPAGARIGGIKSILAERGIPVGSPVAPLPAADPGIWSRMEPML